MTRAKEKIEFGRTWKINKIITVPRGVYFKKLTGGLGFSFLAYEIFDSLIFWGLEKTLLTVLGLKFLFYFLGLTIAVQFILGVR